MRWERARGDNARTIIENALHASPFRDPERVVADLTPLGAAGYLVPELVFLLPWTRSLSLTEIAVLHRAAAYAQLPTPLVLHRYLADRMPSNPARRSIGVLERGAALLCDNATRDVAGLTSALSHAGWLDAHYMLHGLLYAHDGVEPWWFAGSGRLAAVYANREAWFDPIMGAEQQLCAAHGSDVEFALTAAITSLCAATAHVAGTAALPAGFVATACAASGRCWSVLNGGTTPVTSLAYPTYTADGVSALLSGVAAALGVADTVGDILRTTAGGDTYALAYLLAIDVVAQTPPWPRRPCGALLDALCEAWHRLPEARATVPEAHTLRVRSMCLRHASERVALPELYAFIRAAHARADGNTRTRLAYDASAAQLWPHVWRAAAASATRRASEDIAEHMVAMPPPGQTAPEQPAESAQRDNSTTTDDPYGDALSPAADATAADADQDVTQGADTLSGAQWPAVLSAMANLIVARGRRDNQSTWVVTSNALLQPADELQGQSGQDLHDARSVLEYVRTLNLGRILGFMASTPEFDQGIVTAHLLTLRCAINGDATPLAHVYVQVGVRVRVSYIHGAVQRARLEWHFAIVPYVLGSGYDAPPPPQSWARPVRAENPVWAIPTTHGDPVRPDTAENRHVRLARYTPVVDIARLTPEQARAEVYPRNTRVATFDGYGVWRQMYDSDLRITAADIDGFSARPRVFCWISTTLAGGTDEAAIPIHVLYDAWYRSQRRQAWWYVSVEDQPARYRWRSAFDTEAPPNAVVAALTEPPRWQAHCAALATTIAAELDRRNVYGEATESELVIPSGWRLNPLRGATDREWYILRLIQQLGLGRSLGFMTDEAWASTNAARVAHMFSLTAGTGPVVHVGIRCADDPSVIVWHFRSGPAPADWHSPRAASVPDWAVPDNAPPDELLAPHAPGNVAATRVVRYTPVSEFAWSAALAGVRNRTGRDVVNPATTSVEELRGINRSSLFELTTFDGAVIVASAVSPDPPKNCPPGSWQYRGTGTVCWRLFDRGNATDPTDNDPHGPNRLSPRQRLWISTTLAGQRGEATVPIEELYRMWRNAYGIASRGPSPLRQAAAWAPNAHAVEAARADAFARFMATETATPALARLPAHMGEATITVDPLSIHDAVSVNVEVPPAPRPPRTHRNPRRPQARLAPHPEAPDAPRNNDSAGETPIEYDQQRADATERSTNESAGSG